MVDVTQRRCKVCGGPLPAGSTERRQLCSEACKWRNRPRIPCSVCGLPTGWTAGRHQTATHPACRPIEHGTQTMYARGCRCTECRAWKAADFRSYKRHRRAQGRPIPKRSWLPTATRRAVYERDAWTCQLCGDPVDRDAHWNDDLAPSIDHVVPTSQGGTDDIDNLRTSHRWCNCVRGAGRLDDHEFRT